MRSGTGLSGSTHWHNGARGRGYLTRLKVDDDQEPDQDQREIVFLKNNYGRRDSALRLRWRNGLFLPEAAPGWLDKLAEEAKIDDVFMTLLDRFNGQGRNISHKPTANNYAATLFAAEDEAKNASIRKAALEQAMRRLFQADKIHLEPYGPPSRGNQKLVRGRRRNGT